MDIVVDSWFFIQAEHRTMAVFILAVIVNNYNTGQVKILNRNKNEWCQDDECGKESAHIICLSVWLAMDQHIHS